MKIARVEARSLKPRVPIRAPGIDRVATRQLIYVEVETEGGPTGYGISGLAPGAGVVPVINDVCAPLIRGMDARNISAVWDALYRELGHRGQTGLAMHAISGIDIALWDIRGKALGEPVWRLLGGARDRVRCYVTFGLPSFDIDELVAVAKHWVGQGFGGLKMVVGVIALNRADEFPNPTEALREDARRLKAVREAVGDGVEIACDINCELDASAALALARMLAPYDPVFIEEPVPDNDARAMADFKARAGVQVATGQSLGGLYRFADILAHRGADILQPNVVNCGGFTGGLRAADMALGFNVPVCNGGGATAHNLHLQAGVINGTACEWHPYMSMGATEAVFDGCPQPEGGFLVAPDAPGLGMTPNEAALKEFG